MLLAASYVAASPVRRKEFMQPRIYSGPILPGVNGTSGNAVYRDARGRASDTRGFQISLPPGMVCPFFVITVREEEEAAGPCS